MGLGDVKNATLEQHKQNQESQMRNQSRRGGDVTLMEQLVLDKAD